eukprot:TRINITY_DN7319_c0_g1_i2.p1 TRINITY_DN7319_c0_g1~~TRINITY_DN7319_c0_g1_i2.p1  ORF type:complete len:144 (-),score=21.07 TRINITY_DN7319_c0_g1_i2:33-419(-)
MDQLGYIGIGVASTQITQALIKGDPRLHHTPGYSVFYYTGVWYGQNETSTLMEKFNQNDQIHVYFDVESGQVEYYNGSILLGRCKTIGKDEHKKGLRLGVTLSGYFIDSIVSIVDYQPVDAFPAKEDQ